MYNYMPKYISRRNFLTLSTSTILLGLVPRFSYANVIREIHGKIWVNNVLATQDTIIKPGDIIKTGANSQIIFVIGEDVYKLGARSTLRLRYNSKSNNRFINAMRLITGTFTGAFGKGKKIIQTPTATLGIRGTGIFLNVEPNNTYFCTCYGETEIYTGDGTNRQIVNTIHHEAYSISRDNQDIRISSDTMKHHTDEDAHHLESFVGRKPPHSFLN
jgi:hypothetical protein